MGCGLDPHFKNLPEKENHQGTFGIPFSQHLQTIHVRMHYSITICSINTLSAFTLKKVHFKCPDEPIRTTQ